MNELLWWLKNIIHYPKFVTGFSTFLSHFFKLDFGVLLHLFYFCRIRAQVLTGKGCSLTQGYLRVGIYGTGKHFLRVHVWAYGPMNGSIY
jgi:hypothetical protein